MSKKSNSLVGNSTYLVAEKLVRLAVGLFVGISTAKYLGPAGMGTWNYYLAIFTLFSVFASLGIDFVTPREYSAYPNREKQIMGVTLILKIGGSTLAIILSTLFLIIDKGFDIRALSFLLAVTTGYLFQSFDTIEYYFNSKLQSRYSVIARIIAFLAIAGYKLYLVFTGCDLFWFLLSSTFEFGLGAIILVYFLARNQGLNKSYFQFDRLFSFRILRDSLPFALSAFMLAIYYRIDQFMITEMMNEFSNGIFSIAVRMQELILIVPGAIVTSFIPLLAGSEFGKRFTKEETQTQLYAILTWMAIIAMIFILVIGPWLMNLMFGDAFNGSGTVLQIIALGFYPLFTTIAVGNFLVIKNLGKVNFIRNLVGMCLNISLNLWLIPIYGILGAAAASVVSQFTALAVTLSFKSTRNQINLLFRALNPAYAYSFLQAGIKLLLTKK